MILALAGQKGGSGKSTTAIAVAAELFARGRRVLLVDADPQGTSRTWAAIAAESGKEAPTTVGMGADLYKPSQLPTLSKAYDDVVIDCPPRRGDIQRAALMAADLAVLPCGPSAVDAWALAESIELVREAQALRPDLVAYIMITRKVARTAIGQGAKEALAQCGLSVLETELGYRVAYQEAPSLGIGVAQYVPNDAAAAEVRSLVDEIVSLSNGSSHDQKNTADRHQKAATGRPRGRGEIRI
jgi:chromosome partitioning protein